jgi:AcrR family transcriptional regulator
VAESGYAAVRVEDIARHAQISKSTFYAHFTDKEDAFLAGYRATSEALLDEIVATAAAQDTVDAGIRTATEGYLQALSLDPALTRTFIVEVLAAGPAALAARHEVMARFATIIEDLFRARDVEISTATARFLVGGINELILDALVTGRADRLPELADEVVRLAAGAVLAQGAQT